MVDATKVLVSWELMDNITQQAHSGGSKGKSIYMHTCSCYEDKFKPLTYFFAYMVSFDTGKTGL
jgi:hypothetical protein